MKAGGAGRDCAGTARRARNADFLFVGAGVAPLALMLGGLSEIAILFLVPLLLAACLYGMWEQVKAAAEDAAGGSGPMDTSGGKRGAATGVSLRNELRK